jgi:N6-L-threonylcarbamoyladenine synthase
MIVLGIETTCDETAASIVIDGETILSNVIASQINTHKKYGGVFPEIASRLHSDAIIAVIDKALKKAKIKKEQIDLISVAKGPGLIGSILIGLNAAKTLSFSLNKPLIGVNHVEAHLYASMMNSPKIFPAIGVILSGGHTVLVKIENIGSYQIIGATVDDAIGEAFDKVATMLNLPYPGGPQIEKLAKQGNENAYKLKSGKIKDNPLLFSFSGLKTQILYLVKGQSANMHSEPIINEEEKKHIAASFQKTAFEDVFKKTLLATDMHHCKAIYLGGGVTNNQTLRDLFIKGSPLPCFFPEKALSLDNAVMIAGLGYWKYKYLNQIDNLHMETTLCLDF